jgi:DNA-binding NtrC family response regulator
VTPINEQEQQKRPCHLKLVPLFAWLQPMSLMTLDHTGLDGRKLLPALILRTPEIPQVLIVCNDDGDTGQLKTAFRQAGLASESADNMAAGCEAAGSGRFGVIFSSPFAGDGSWTRLIEVASQRRLGFEIVLLARTFDLSQWVEALQVGAFEVLDVLRDLPQAAEAAQRAFSAAYLKRFRTRAN